MGEAGDRAEARLWWSLRVRLRSLSLVLRGRKGKKNFEQGAVCSGLGSRKISP